MKAIVFDFDGTIIDTETAWYYAFRDRYKEHGVELTLEQYSLCLGTSLDVFNPYTYLKTELKLEVDERELRDTVHRDHAERMSRERIRNGVLELLRQAKDAGWKIGLATSSKRAWIDSHLDQLGIRDYFEVIRTADDVSRVKPDPDLYIQAIAALGVMPYEAVAIEDSPNGARAAVTAGLHCVVVPNELTKQLSFDESERCLHAECLTNVDIRSLAARAQ